MKGWLRVLLLVFGLILACTPGLRGQSSEGLPLHDDLETDADKDGVPDGWYNLRDARWAEGGMGEGHCFRLENRLPGRPSRVSRAFAVDGRKVESLVIGLWVQLEGVQPGERLGEQPGLMIDLLGDELKTLSRTAMSPWTQKACGNGWVRLAQRVHVHPQTHDAIITLGLLGATGVLEFDELTIDTTPVGGQPTTNLVRNGDVELGNPTPVAWVLEAGARRVSPGHRSGACLDLSRAAARASVALGGPLDAVSSVNVTLSARASGLRGSGATGTFYFVDDEGEPLAAYRSGSRLFRFHGSFDWRTERASLAIPAAASGVVLQFDKPDAVGSLKIDDVTIVAAPDPATGRWVPDQVATDQKGWNPYTPAPLIRAGTALDFSFLLATPAGSAGRVQVREGRLTHADGQRARFLGVTLLPPLACPDPDRANALATQLARSGVNLVRIGELDAPLGPGRSLIDDVRDDTRGLDGESLARFDHLIAALKSKGIAIALEFQTLRQFRGGDGVADSRELGPGGGPAAAFDPTLRDRAVEFATAILSHVNPETGLPLRDDPALVWVTLAGELSLFDQSDDNAALPPSYGESLRKAIRAEKFSGKRAWQALETAQWQAERASLVGIGLKAPIAGVSHWRRESEFSAAQATLDLIDDRLYWKPRTWAGPDRRSLLWDRGGLAAEANRKRKADRPYVVGQFAEHTRGAWALPFAGDDFLFAAWTARQEDWDALVRRGLYLHPEVWGAAAPGTSGGLDFLRIPEVVNANPQVFALLPHAASLLIRQDTEPTARPAVRKPPSRRDVGTGRVLIDTPTTQGVAGWPGRQRQTLSDSAAELDVDHALVVASSVGPEPIASSRRLLVTAIGRCEPSGLRWTDHRREEVADPGRPPLLLEPMRGRYFWKRTGTIRAFALDASGERVAPVSLTATADGVTLELGNPPGTIHWELVIDE